MDLLLTCRYETWTTRDWDAYSLKADHIICGATGVTWTQNNIECRSPCIFFDQRDSSFTTDDRIVNSACSIVNETGLDNTIFLNDKLFYTWTFCEWSVDFVVLLWGPRDPFASFPQRSFKHIVPAMILCRTARQMHSLWDFHMSANLLWWRW
jgi:hypothetical protein